MGIPLVVRILLVPRSARLNMSAGLKDSLYLKWERPSRDVSATHPLSDFLLSYYTWRLPSKLYCMLLPRLNVSSTTDIYHTECVISLMSDCTPPSFLVPAGDG